ncbi:DNA methyltransferase [Candidatus Methylobacter favarea]|uniref:site-specific DNA-methyltransferase (adenine-specific) n=1 Tax=Candidatus Methylobacter favarea TaxID=2707345 RepID=A0A8S0WBZ6_9GAMM|nr:DNA adenine methylase [Candidatus Methylobacter favarea]CAA9892055.1 DNA methyltransferase [Candidatus Methylobacter favarea]
MAFNTPLRYPGGKGRLSNFVRETIDLNGLRGGEYVELYAGGAGIAITLLLNNVVSRVHINDLNRSIYAFWNTVLHNSDRLCQRITKTNVTIEEWAKQRAVQSDINASMFDLGFSTFFLNRTNHSGIIGAGAIGGKNQAGHWKLDARFNKPDLVARIQKIAAMSDRISLYDRDASAFIKHELPNITDMALVYLDPPYYVKGKGLYQNHYDYADHAEIAGLVTSIKQKWLVTYDNNDRIKAFYSDFPQRNFGLKYSANGRYCGNEVLITKPNLILPPMVQPTRAALPISLLKNKNTIL